MKSDSLNLKKIISILIKYKYLYLFFILISLALSYLYLLFENKYLTYQFSLKSPQIDQIMILNMLNKNILELNSGVKLDYFKKAKNAISSIDTFRAEALANASRDKNENKITTPLEEKIFIDEKYIIKTYYAILKSRTTHEEVKEYLITNFPDINAQEIQNIKVVSINMLQAGEENFEGSNNIIVQVSHRSSKEFLKLFSDYLFFISNRHMIKELYKIIEVVKNSYELSLNSEIKDTDLINIEIYNNYSNYIDTKVLLLEEQIGIARSINLENPLELDQNNIKFSFSTLEELLKSTDTYLLGYKILENKLNIIKKRKNIELFLPEYRINKNYINALKNDQKINQFYAFLDNYNINLNSEISKTYRFMSIEDNSSFSLHERDKNIIYPLFIIISLVASLLISFLREIFLSEE